MLAVMRAPGYSGTRDTYPDPSKITRKALNLFALTHQGTYDSCIRSLQFHLGNDIKESKGLS